MAWRCSGKTNEELINNLYKNSLIKSPTVKAAMSKVDRAHFCPDTTYAYEDSPQSIGHAATISAPHMHASATESLLPFLYPGAKVLDIGSGSGYLTAVLAELVCSKPGGKVVGLEHIKPLRDLGESNILKSEAGRKLVSDGAVSFVVGDGRKGWKDEGGEEWDAIHVGAAAVELHSVLIEQLKRPGRLFIPVEDERGYSGNQYIWVVDKDKDGNVKKERQYGVRYVPLTDAPK
ncbi:protein-L-isoaspartate O-methyltransferase [Bisporella sp. PMI_857]|nr:protein-L-isoaspartate O-methyltransferase [Bisporella sp. PMI_857]